MCCSWMLFYCGVSDVHVLVLYFTEGIDYILLSGSGVFSRHIV